MERTKIEDEIAALKAKIEEYNAILADEGRPVSYTHLDVYKRQDTGFSRSRHYIPQKEESDDNKKADTNKYTANRKF